MPVHSALGPGHPPPHDACCPLHSPRLNADNVTKPVPVFLRHDRHLGAHRKDHFAACLLQHRAKPSANFSYALRSSGFLKRRNCETTTLPSSNATRVLVLWKFSIEPVVS